MLIVHDSNKSGVLIFTYVFLRKLEKSGKGMEVVEFNEKKKEKKTVYKKPWFIELGKKGLLKLLQGKLVIRV